MPVGKFLSGDYETMCEDIQELKNTCGENVAMKVILETGCLKTASNIKKASILSMYSGADYIKTSTGKEKISATPEAAYVMCQAIKEYYDETGIQIGFKPAGGIIGRKVAHQQMVPIRHQPTRQSTSQRDRGKRDEILLKN